MCYYYIGDKMKRGFTLVELLASIAIMALIIVISVPAYNSISNTIKTNSLKSKKSMLENATKSYIDKYYKDEVNVDGSDCICFTIKHLIDNNVVSPDNKDNNGLTDPLNGGDLEGKVCAWYVINDFDIKVKYNINCTNITKEYD